MQIAVVGAGTMGADIAQVAALGQHSVILHDVDDATLRRALARASRGIDQGVQRGKLDPFMGRRAKRRFRLTSDVHQCAAADLVIEAVYDDPDLKQSVLRALDKTIRPNAILATTTNTLSVTRLAAMTRLPERVVGLHFLNPAHVMRLVEVVRSDRTQPDVIERVMAFVRTIHKSPVLLDDVPGLIVNRVAMAYFGEALRLVDDVGLEVAMVDRLMEAAGFPMGPFRLMDFVGVDAVQEVSLAMWEATFYDVPYRPHPRIQRMVEAGLVGRGNRGFYDGADA
jgi:3-hydroxybutyryl-CoA dehydrogenase